MMQFRNLWFKACTTLTTLVSDKLFTLFSRARTNQSFLESQGPRTVTKSTSLNRRDCPECGSDLDKFYLQGVPSTRCRTCDWLEDRELYRDAWEEEARRHVTITEKEKHQDKSARIGEKAEEIVANILEKFKSEGFINGYRQSRKNDKDDCKGIDFRIFTPCEKGQLTIPLQVKSSWKGANIHNRKYNDYRNRRERRHHFSKSRKRRRIGNNRWGEAVERIPVVVAYDPGCEHELRSIIVRYVFYYGVV
jgi:hypothetical protein